MKKNLSKSVQRRRYRRRNGDAPYFPRVPYFPRPLYVWGRLGSRAEYVKIMINSGNTVGDLFSEELAQQMGLDGDKVQDHIAVPTAATATTVLVVRRCQEMTATLEGIEGEFTIRPLVVRGLTHPVNLGIDDLYVHQH